MNNFIVIFIMGMFCFLFGVLMTIIPQSQIERELHKNGCLTYQGTNPDGTPKSVATEKNCNEILLDIMKEIRG